jgi:hypothetical protein
VTEKAPLVAGLFFPIRANIDDSLASKRAREKDSCENIPDQLHFPKSPSSIDTVLTFPEYS